MDMRITLSDCDFEMEGLGLVVAAFDLPDWYSEALAKSLVSDSGNVVKTISLLGVCAFYCGPRA